MLFATHQFLTLGEGIPQSDPERVVSDSYKACGDEYGRRPSYE